MGFVRLILVGVFTGIYVRKLSILDKEIGIVFAHKFLDKNKKSEIKGATCKFNPHQVANFSL